MSRPRVVLVRGHQANSWHLRPWSRLADRFDVVLLQTKGNWFDTGAADLAPLPVRTLRDYFPRAGSGELAVRVPGDRYLGLRDRLAGADIVHPQDLVFWYSAQAAELKPELDYKLVLTVWETLPFLDAYRNFRTRPYRRPILEQTDLFLCTTERAKTTLLLEGADEERIVVSPPGVDLDLFRSAPVEQPDHHVIVSAGRLVWEKGHQELLRALALIDRPDVRGSDHRVGPGGEAAQAPRRRARARRPGRVPPRGALRRDAVGLRAGIVPRARQHPNLVLGRAVRDGPGRGDGGRAPSDRRIDRRDPGSPGRERAARRRWRLDRPRPRP